MQSFSFLHFPFFPTSTPCFALCFHLQILARDCERKTPLVVGLEDVDLHEKRATLVDTLAHLIKTNSKVRKNNIFILPPPLTQPTLTRIE